MTEKIGGALQKLIQRCKSARRLKNSRFARVLELEDSMDLKSIGDLISVRVQVSPRAQKNGGELFSAVF